MHEKLTECPIILYLREKLTKFLNFAWHMPEKINKMPEFYMFLPENIFPNFGGRRQVSPLPLSPTPMLSYSLWYFDWASMKNKGCLFLRAKSSETEWKMACCPVRLCSMWLIWNVLLTRSAVEFVAIVNTVWIAVTDIWQRNTATVATLKWIHLVTT